MSIVCVNCGSPLAEGQAFCTKCGARRPESSRVDATSACTGCGAPLGAGAKFCEKCGTAVSPGSVHALPTIEAVRSVVAPSVPAPTQSGSKLLKVIMIAAALLVLFLVAAMGSCAYIAYRAKQRIDKVQQAYKKDDLSGMVAAATGQTSKPQPLPDWKAAPAELVSAPSSKIPMRKSLRLIDAGSDVLRGDFESIYMIDKVTDEFVHIRASQQYPPGQGIQRFLNSGASHSDKPLKIDCGRTILRTDMENSVETDGYLCRDGRDEKRPGTTAMGLSKRTLNELRTTGQSELTYHEDPLKAVLKSFKNAMASDDKNADASSQDLLKKMMNFAPGGVMTGDVPMDTPPLKCTLRRNGTGDVAFPVLINDQKAELPVMDVVVKLPDKEGHLYVLDDPENPLVLAAGSTEGGHQQIIKIYWDAERPSNQLEQDLEKNGRAKVYDLYFDFASATLRPESNKVLKEIAQVMRAHPDWKLTVEGHTDNIGGNKSNLDLSKRRSEAVVHELVNGYYISENRFTAATGFGASRPVDTNDTLQGRARNRRVELARQ
jgi:outer membrane protein OmpA-like peptidoglycan-associated protein